MTFLVKDIADHLTASSAIVNAFSDRIYASVAPQQEAEYPRLIINDLSNDPAYSLRGEVGTHTSQIQIDVWTDGKGGVQPANVAAELVRNRLSGYRGQFGTGCYGTARMTRNDTLASPPVDGSDVHRRRVSMDFEIIHSADVPTFT